jgi:uncharacterized protein (TIGR02246 family)
MKRTVTCALLLFVGVAAAARPEAGPAPAPAGAGVQQLNDAFLKALQSGDIDGIMKLYAADAVLFPPGEKVAKGLEEIRFKWNDLIQANKISEMALNNTRYLGSCTVSSGWGDVAMRLEPKNGKEAKNIQGRFTAVAEKRDGKWAYVFVGIGELDEILTLKHYSKKP